MHVPAGVRRRQKRILSANLSAGDLANVALTSFAGVRAHFFGSHSSEAGPYVLRFSWALLLSLRGVYFQNPAPMIKGPLASTAAGVWPPFSQTALTRSLENCHLDRHLGLFHPGPQRTVASANPVLMMIVAAAGRPLMNGVISLACFWTTSPVRDVPNIPQHLIPTFWADNAFFRRGREVSGGACVLFFPTGRNWDLSGCSPS